MMNILNSKYIKILFINRMVKPNIKRGQVLIHVRTCSINPCDVKLRFNPISNYFIPLPKIPGCDFYGIIVEYGENESTNLNSGNPQSTSNFKIGDRVTGMLPIVFSGWGSNCEYIAIDQHSVCLAPSEGILSDEQIATLPLASLTIQQGFASFVRSNTHSQGNSLVGKKVLIQAGSGLIIILAYIISIFRRTRQHSDSVL